MSLNLFRWLSFNATVIVLILLAALYLWPSAPAAVESKQPPQVLLISLCGELKGAAITSYPLSWYDQFTPMTPELTALSLIAKEAGDVYEFEAGSDAVCAQLGIRK